jgi:prepilin-type processing-associated H-X9-DG protein
MIDEDERSLDDGNFNMDAKGSPVENYLSTRHDGHQQDVTARGNVSFCDGHADFVSREYTQDNKHLDPGY